MLLLGGSTMRLADFIDANTEEIVAEWESFARTLLPAAAGLNPIALRDHAAQILNEDHYGIQKVKDRIIEYIAVRKLAGDKVRAPDSRAQIAARRPTSISPISG